VTVKNLVSPETPTAKPKLSRVDEFDGLRGILASWVALSHIFCWCGFAFFPFAHFATARAIGSRMWPLFSFAAAPVDAFIILSGFAISYLLHARQQSYGQFVTGRFFRIYPVYFICLLAGIGSVAWMPTLLANLGWGNNDYLQIYVCPVVAAAQTQPVAHLAAHLSLLFGVLPEKILPETTHTFLAPAWSISLEWQYYLIAPLLAWAVRRPKGLLLAGLVGAGGGIYSRFWGGAFLPEKISLFLIGIGSYHLLASATQLKNFRHWPLAIAGLLATTWAMGWHWLALSIWAIVFGGVLASAAGYSAQWQEAPRRFLLQPALQRLGKISYPLYLVHWPIIIGLLAGLLRWQPNISSGTALGFLLAVGMPLILFCAWLLHVLVEKPFMDFGKKFTR
jgi:peptidoglycan/LPS O-acetylase OafA/YrhL